jgi:alpha-beta hydrolase superfamily lysophospholipase
LAEDSRVVHSVRLDAYYGLIRFTDHASDDIAALSADTRLPPTLLLHGDRDETVPRVAIERLVSDWPSASRDTLEIHYLPEAPHLLLQWHDSEQVRGRIAHWLAEILPARASQE